MSLLYALFKIGYDKNGYDKNGYDREGFDCNGYDKNGYNRNGYDANGYDREGYNSQKEEFINVKKKYEEGKENSEYELALCYLNAIGVKKDIRKAFSIAIDGAFNSKCKKCLRLIGDFYNEGRIVNKNTLLSTYIYDICEGVQITYQYKAMNAITFNKKRNQIYESNFREEEKKLEETIEIIDSEIIKNNSRRVDIDNESWYMDQDQREQLQYDRLNNNLIDEKSWELEEFKKSPYYARMDTICNGYDQSYYIAEKVPTCMLNHKSFNIVSVWSEFGRKYRDRNKFDFRINSFDYEVTLRRRLDIKNSKIIEIYDDYIKGVTAEAITDPYLLKVLEEKKGEKNITNIIKSIQQNQNDIIEENFNHSIVVQGCAGSGKTMILLHRLANMKYNLPKLELKKIKIITPNKQFNMYIDELSKNLELDKVEKLTLNDYYVELMNKYRERFPKIKMEILEEGAQEYKYILSGKTNAEEAKTFDYDYNLSIYIVSTIYSDEFAKEMVECSKELTLAEPSRDYGYVLLRFKEYFEKILASMGIKQKINKNFTCVLYAKLLFLLSYYGPIGNDMLLCIDEGQDISKLQYLLLKRVNKEDLIFNIYGDVNQQIPEYCGIGNWKDITKFIGADYFELNENYRNSDNIIKYYKEKLKISNQSFGLKTKDVEEVKYDTLYDLLRIQLILNNRVALICNDSSKVPGEVMKICTSNIKQRERVTLLSVKECKGLEFDTVFVIEDEMDNKEKYIAYTRALSELYIIK